MLRSDHMATGTLTLMIEPSPASEWMTQIKLVKLILKEF